MTHNAIIEARSWLGTPFMSGASVRGVGTDCAGLIEGIARAVNLDYPPRQAVEHDIVAAARTFLVAQDWLETGCLVLLSRDPGGAPLHAAIVTDVRHGISTLIHAHWSAGVVENRFGSWFQRRVTHIFAWPDTSQVLKQ